MKILAGGAFGPARRTLTISTVQQTESKPLSPVTLAVIQKRNVISQMALGQHAPVHQLGVFAVTADALFQKVCALFDRIAAGGDEG